jgi:hypothetical protein
MKHVFLIPFNEGKSNETWETILSIKATRLIASRSGRFSYLTGPRVMTDKEQQDTFGEVDQANIVAITMLKDLAGNQAPGYGRWPKNKAVYGEDKGNTKENMAIIRSERQAFERLLPGEMPLQLEAVDE